MATEQEGNLATEQESNHHEISLTSSMANSNEIATTIFQMWVELHWVYIKRIQVQLQASNFGTTVELSGGGGGVVVYCIMDRHT